MAWCPALLPPGPGPIPHLLPRVLSDSVPRSTQSGSVGTGAAGLEARASSSVSLWPRRRNLPDEGRSFPSACCRPVTYSLITTVTRGEEAEGGRRGVSQSIRHFPAL